MAGPQIGLLGRAAFTAVLCVGIVAMGGVASRASGLPPTFAAWADKLEGFTTVQMGITVDYPPGGRHPSCQAWLYANATQTKAAIDWVTCASMKYSWDGNQLRSNLLSNGTRLKSMDLGPIVSDVWGELRAGFANSSVVAVNQDQEGLRGFRGSWFKLTLPFAWAAPYTVYVDLSPGSHELAILQVCRGTNSVLQATVYETTWNKTVSAAHLGPYASAGTLPTPNGWRTDVVK
jgi:hypothetical protein